VVIQPSMLMIGWFALFLFLRAGLIALLQRFVFRRWLHRPLISLVSELLQPLHLMHAVLSRKIDWRGRKYHVFASDRFESYE
jgi:ceramide glucosyltransferase